MICAHGINSPLFFCGFAVCATNPMFYIVDFAITKSDILSKCIFVVCDVRHNLEKGSADPFPDTGRGQAWSACAGDKPPALRIPFCADHINVRIFQKDKLLRKKYFCSP